MLKVFFLAATMALASGMTYAQAIDAAKETGKSVAEGTKEGVDKSKAAFESGSSKAVDKTKGAVHGAKAKHHRHKAKAAANAAVH
jgi:hypothetical protein